MDNTGAIILGIALAIIMLGMGLSLVIEDFKRVVTYPKAVLLGLFNQLVLLPLFGYLIAVGFKLPMEIAVGIMILAACPGGPTSNLITYLAKGDTALSVSLTAISSFVTIVTIPFIINFSLENFATEGQVVKLNIPETILQILVVVIIPVIIGMIIRRNNEAFALRMAKPVRTASGIVLALVIVGIILKEQDNFVSYFEQAGHAALVLNILTMAFGYYSSKLFKIEEKRAIAIAIESGIQNGTLAISIAVVLLGSSAFAIAPAVYSLIMFFTGGAAIWMGIRKMSGEGKP